MKIVKRVYLTMVFIGMCFCLCLETAQAQAVSYVGEFCFSLTSGYGDPGKTFQLGVLSYGAGHLPLDGKVTVAGTSQPMPVHGTAFLDHTSGSIMATLTSSGVSSAGRPTYSITYYLTADPNTMSGQYTSIEHFDELTFGPQPRDHYIVSIDGGTITPIACP